MEGSMRVVLKSIFLFLFLSNFIYPQSLASTKWTVMVYLNADNNLEEFGIIDFNEMAEVGSTGDINIIVQMDRIGKYIETDPQWTQTLRFRVEKGMKAIPKNAFSDLGEVNMGSGEKLNEFVKYCQQYYPANHYFLVIWDHGQGWRTLTKSWLFNPEKKELTKKEVSEDENIAFPFRSTSSAAFKSVSNDETNKDKLYNREIQDSLQNTVNPLKKLDIIGFDACLMGMVETAYAMRNISDYMVASEELEPGWGWDYRLWLKKLIENPNMTSEQLANLVVASYRDSYSSTPGTTFSAINLSKISLLATQISTLADSLSARLNDSSLIIAKARKLCREYAPNAFGDGKDYFHHIDLGYFCEKIAEQNISPLITSQAQTINSTLASTVISCYAHDTRKEHWGSNGLAIYFPRGNDDYLNDQYAQNGYEQGDTHYPVEFVQTFLWDEFLHKYWMKIN